MSGVDREIEDGLAELLHHLAFFRGASLWLVVVSDLSLQDTVAAAIRAKVGASWHVAEHRYTPSSLSLAERLRSLTPHAGGSILFVLDLDLLQGSDRTRALDHLNRGREALLEVPYTTILFLLPPSLGDVIHRAGDFWAWRRGVVDLSHVKAPSPSEGSMEALRQRYLEHIRRSYEGGSALQDVYVPFQRLLRASSGEEERIADAFSSTSKMLVLGEPRSGKTAFLRYLLLTYAGGEDRVLERLHLRERRLPVLLSLRGVASDQSLDAVEMVRALIVRAGLHPFVELVEDCLGRGEALILFDGLDTIHDDLVPRMIRALPDRFPGNRWIVTSRSHARSVSQLEGDFERYVLPGFDRRALVEYARRFWDRGFESTSSKEETFVRTIEASPLLRRMATQPQLLQIMTRVYDKTGVLNVHRAELYKQAIEPLAATPAQARALESIARSLLESGARSLRATPPGIDEAPVDALIARGMILVEESPGAVRFAHLWMQEYFAACAILREGRLGANVRAHIHDPSWTEPLRLAVGLAVKEGNADAESMIMMVRSLNSAHPEQDLLAAGKLVADLGGKPDVLGPAVLDPLLALLLDPATPPSLSDEVISVLAEIAGGMLFEVHVGPSLLRGLQHDAPLIRARCASVLAAAAQPGPAVAKALIAGLQSEDAEVKRLAQSANIHLTPEAWAELQSYLP